MADLSAIHRFELDGDTWSLAATFDGDDDESFGARGLAVAEVGDAVIVLAVTSEAEGGLQVPRVVAYIDDGGDSADPIEIVPHAKNTLFRGISLPPLGGN